MIRDAQVRGAFLRSILSVIFTDRFALSQSDARIPVAYNNLSVKITDKKFHETVLRSHCRGCRAFAGIKY